MPLFVPLLARARFSEAGAADPAIAAPVVAFLIEHAAEVEAVRYRFTEEASKLITSWLRSVRRAVRQSRRRPRNPPLSRCGRRRPKPARRTDPNGELGLPQTLPFQRTSAGPTQSLDRSNHGAESQNPMARAATTLSASG